MTAGYLDLLEEAFRRVRVTATLDRLRIVWTASRDLPPEFLGVSLRVGELIREFYGREVRLAHGCARGGDQLAERLIAEHRWQPGRHPVPRSEWRQYGGHAGHRRNDRMLQAEQPDLVIALIHNGSHGATGCRDNALARGILTVTIDQELARTPRTRATL